jgi:hypothetical protein
MTTWSPRLGDNLRREPKITFVIDEGKHNHHKQETDRQTGYDVFGVTRLGSPSLALSATAT